MPLPRSNSLLSVLVPLAAAAFCDAPATAATLLYYDPLDEGGGTTTVNLGSNGAAENGTLQGNATLVASGKIGGSLKLDGSAGTYVSLGHSPLSGSTARTVSIWVQTTTTSLNTAMSFGTNTGLGVKWDMDVDGVATQGNGVAELGVGGARTTGSGTKVNDGQWHLITMTLPSGSNNLNQTNIYVDGVFQYTGNTAMTIATTGGASSVFYLGSSANSAGFQAFNGSLDDAAVWSTDLGASRIMALFELGNVAGIGAGGADALFTSFDGSQSAVTTGGLTWTYQASGIGGNTGDVLSLGNGNYSLNLGNGAGFLAIPEPSSMALGFAGLLICGTRFRRK